VVSLLRSGLSHGEKRAAAEGDLLVPLIFEVPDQVADFCGQRSVPAQQGRDGLRERLQYGATPLHDRVVVSYRTLDRFGYVCVDVDSSSQVPIHRTGDAFQDVRGRAARIEQSAHGACARPGAFGIQR